MAEVVLTLERVFQKGLIAFKVPEDVDIQEALKKVLMTCHNKYHDFVQITFRPPYKPRTTGKKSQNHHLNGHIIQLCNATQHDYETIKYCVKMKAVENFGYPYDQIAGHIVPKSERNCDTEECAKLIEAAHLLAAEWEIVLREE